MNRVLICVVLALAYLLFAKPAAQPKPAPSDKLGTITHVMAAPDKAALSEMYGILARSIEADPEAEPVFVDTAMLRRAHRGALLLVWKGVLNNPAAKYPELKDYLESEVGTLLADDVILNPELRKQAVAKFFKLSNSFK